MRRTVQLLAPSLLALSIATGAQATYVVSIISDHVIDGQLFNNGDLFTYDAGSGAVASYLPEEMLFEEDVDVNAAAFLPDGHVLFSIASNAGALAGGVLVGDGDLAEYDQASGEVSIYLPQSVYGTNVDVNAAHVLDDGRVLVSFRRDETIGGVLYQDGDVVAYDPGSGTFAMFFPESTFVGQDVDIDGFAVTQAGTYLISTAGAATLGGVTWNDAEVVEYDPATDTATLLFAVTGGASDLNALAVEPPAECADGLDNDGDGYVDSQDPACPSADWEREAAACQDGLDNDGDGGIDFDGGATILGLENAVGADPACGVAWTDTEGGLEPCGSGFQLAFVLPALVGLRRLRGRRR